MSSAAAWPRLSSREALTRHQRRPQPHRSRSASGGAQLACHVLCGGHSQGFKENGELMRLLGDRDVLEATWKTQQLARSSMARIVWENSRASCACGQYESSAVICSFSGKRLFHAPQPIKNQNSHSDEQPSQGSSPAKLVQVPSCHSTSATSQNCSWKLSSRKHQCCVVGGQAWHCTHIMGTKQVLEIVFYEPGL